MKAGWQTKKLGEICLIQPPKSEARKNLNGSDLVSFVPMESMGIGQKYFDASKVRAFEEIAGSYTYFANGDVLLAKITPCFENGKLGIARNLKNGVGFGSSEYIVFRGAETLHNQFLYYFLSRETFREEGAKRMAGAVGHKRVAKDFIENSIIPLPPLPEQQRIVAILDEAFAGIATATANAKKNLNNARELFASYLQFVFMQTDDGWIEDKLVLLTTKIGSGATPLGGEKAYKDKGISLIRSLNVYDMGFRYGKLAFIDETQAEKLSNVELLPRDVLLNITGASVARCCVVPENVLPARVNQHVSIIRPIADKLDAEFLYYALISKPYKDKLLQTGEVGGSTRQAITKAQLQEFKIAHPKSLQEQKVVVAKLYELSAETKKLEAIYQQKLGALDALKKFLLNQAFAGEL